MGLSIFDDNVTTEVKANISQIMLKAEKGEEAEEEAKRTEEVHSAPKLLFFLYKHRVYDFCNSWYKTLRCEIFSKHRLLRKDDPSHKSELENLKKTVVVNDVTESHSKSFRIAIKFSQKMKLGNNLFYRS